MSTPSQPVLLRSILIFSSHLRPFLWRLVVCFSSSVNEPHNLNTISSSEYTVVITWNMLNSCNELDFNPVLRIANKKAYHWKWSRVVSVYHIALLLMTGLVWRLRCFVSICQPVCWKYHWYDFHLLIISKGISVYFEIYYYWLFFSIKPLLKYDIYRIMENEKLTMKPKV